MKLNSEEFKNWFGNSKVVNSDGEPLKVYHGSKAIFDQFEMKYIGSGHGHYNHGKGFYFTTDKSTAMFYGDKIYECYLKIQTPLNSDQSGNLSIANTIKFIKNSPNLDFALTNWGSEDEFDTLHKKNALIYKLAVENYSFKSENIVSGLLSIYNDFYGHDTEHFNKQIHKILGFDGIMKSFLGNTKVFVAFYPEQIKIVKNIN